MHISCSSVTKACGHENISSTFGPVIDTDILLLIHRLLRWMIQDVRLRVHSHLCWPVNIVQTSPEGMNILMILRSYNFIREDLNEFKLVSSNL